MAQSFLGRWAMIVVLAVVAGGIHSWLRPIIKSIDPNKLTPTIVNGATPTGTTPAPSTPNDTSPAGTTPSPTPGTHENPGTNDSGPRALGLEITSADAKILFDRGVPFLDARRHDEFDLGHVPQAVVMPPDEFPSRAAEVMVYSPGPVVIYCDGGQCDASHNLAKLMQSVGFTQIHIMTDGLPGWKNAGFPTESK
ncbi:MAG: rhodanese-like domain-containing protein [Phycisphaerales bacterium]